MASYVLAFRGSADRTPSPAEEAAWTTWFQDLGSAITDRGHRVGQVKAVGGNGPTASAPDTLTGYVVIAADSLQHAADLAGGCPGLRSGGRVEVGEIADVT